MDVQESQSLLHGEGAQRLVHTGNARFETWKQPGLGGSIDRRKSLDNELNSRISSSHKVHQGAVPGHDGVRAFLVAHQVIGADHEEEHLWAVAQNFRQALCDSLGVSPVTPRLRTSPAVKARATHRLP